MVWGLDKSDPAVRNCSILCRSRGLSGSFDSFLPLPGLLQARLSVRRAMQETTILVDTSPSYSPAKTCLSPPKRTLDPFGTSARTPVAVGSVRQPVCQDLQGIDMAQRRRTLEITSSLGRSLRTALTQNQHESVLEQPALVPFQSGASIPAPRALEIRRLLRGIRSGPIAPLSRRGSARTRTSANPPPGAMFSRHQPSLRTSSCMNDAPRSVHAPLVEVPRTLQRTGLEELCIVVDPFRR